MSESHTPRPWRDPTHVSLARFVAATLAEGPGVRTAVWVQGCAIRCPGCFNPHMWSFRPSGLIPWKKLLADVLQAGTDGITLLGGEPFDQAAPLGRLAAEVRATGRSVITFTGYTARRLERACRNGRDDVRELLDSTDLLVAGPFRADRIDHLRPWVGSTNQEVILRNERHADLLTAMSETPDRLEITVNESGHVAVNGWAPGSVLDSLLADWLRPAQE